MNIVERIINAQTTQAEYECNYSNDYYGDRVCVLRK